jgi:hypothetical protein
MPFKRAVSHYDLSRCSSTDWNEACKLVFLASEVGSRSLSGHINILRGSSRRNSALPDLRRVVCLGGSQVGEAGVEMQTYNTFTSNGHSVFMNDSVLKRAESLVRPDDVLNLQFTSGMKTNTAAILPSHSNQIS